MFFVQFDALPADLLKAVREKLPEPALMVPKKRPAARK